MREVGVVSSAEALVAMSSYRYREEMARDMVFAAGAAAANKGHGQRCR